MGCYIGSSNVLGARCSSCGNGDRCCYVVRLVKGLHDEDHPEIDLIMEIKSFLSCDWELNICQISRDVNSCADFIAKHALQGMPGYIQFFTPFDRLGSMIHSEREEADLFDPD